MMKIMNNKLVKLFTILIILILAISNISLTKAGVSNSARKAALEFLKEQSIVNPKLSNATVDFPCVYTDKSLHEHFIVYAIKKYESIIGRIVLLKTKDKYIVLEMGETPPPHIDYSKKIPEHIFLKEGETIGQAKFIYVFPLLYFVHFNILKDGKLSRDVYFYWNEKRIVTLADIPDVPILANGKSPFMKRATSGSFGSYKILSDVPDFITPKELCNSCGPTAGANICGYWHKHGYYYLQHDWDENGNDLITCLWHDMNTNCVYGTPASNFRAGIVYHANTVHGSYLGIYHFSASGDSSPHFSDAVNEISYDRPFGILIREQGSWTWWHWITCIGYYSGYDEYIYVRDGWGDGTVAINWNASSLPDPDHPGQYIPIFIDGFDYVFPEY